MKIETRSIYVAFDGKEFQTEDDCRSHERAQSGGRLVGLTEAQIAAARNAVPRLIATIAAREAEIAQLKDLLREVSATSARIPANPVMATFSLNTLAKIDVALKESHND